MTRQPGSRMEALSQRSASIPFRYKLSAVWLAVLGVVATVFWVSRFDIDWMKENFLFIATGLRITIFIAVIAIILAITMALLGALGRLSKNPVAFGLAGFYTSFFRGTPLIVQMFLIYFALPQMGKSGPKWLADMLILDAVPAGILALGLNYGAYMTEIFRAGIQSVSGGQTEAAEALGMSYLQTMRRVILPQAVRVIIPPTGNEFIAMMKDTALVSFLGATASQLEIFRKAQLLGRADNRNLEAFIVSAVLYWALTTVFTYFQGRLERKLATGYVREGAPAPKAVTHA